MSHNTKTTIYDISEKLKVSAATVSRALNDNPKISIKTRELVRKTAKEMNYHQNRLAQAFQKGKTNNVGVVVPFINRNFFSSVIRGIEEKLSPHGYHVIICQTHEDVKTEKEQIKILLGTQVDGIIMSVSKTTQNTDHIKEVLDQGKPLIFFDRRKDIPGVSSVTINDFEGAFAVTEHLIKQGCENIAYLSGDRGLDIYAERYRGYLAALKAYNLAFEKDYVFDLSNTTIESGTFAVKNLWNLNKKPDAIFSSGDYAALGALQELKRKNIKIPQEVCLSGFSNEAFTEYTEPSITSVDQTPLLMGKIAAEVFLEQIQGSQTLTIEKKVVLKPGLRIRNSSKRK